MTEIIMPNVQSCIQTGKIIKWLVREGEHVTTGDTILHVEMDKIRMDVKAFASGVVLKLLAQQGDTIPATQVIGYIGKAGEKIAQSSKLAHQSKRKINLPEQYIALNRSDRIANSLTKALSNSSVLPSDNHTEIKSKDSSIKKVALMDGDKKLPLSSTHCTAQPFATIHTKANVTGLLADREKNNHENKTNITVNDYIIEACAQAIKKTPNVNIIFGGDCLVRRKHIHIGVAVATDEAVPIIKDADTLRLDAISDTMKQLTDKAKHSGLTADDCSNAALCISNLGMYGVTYFTPIIHPPQTLVLGVNAIEKTLQMHDDGTLYYTDTMGLSLTFDTRAHDNASAAMFLKTVIDSLEQFHK